jgi:hypothetical protein
MVEAGGGAGVEISPGKAGLWFWCCFSVTGGGRVEGKMEWGELFDFQPK